MINMDLFYSVEAEQATIGGILMDSTMIDLVAGAVAPKDFYGKDAQLIYAAMVREVDAGREVDLVSLADYLEKSAPMDGEDWIVKLARIERNTASTTNTKRYAEKVREYAMLRELFRAGSEIQEIAKDHELTAEQRIGKSQEYVASLFDSNDQKGPRLIKDLTRGFVEHMDRCHNAKGGVTGLSTGFSNIDQRTGGFQPGELIVFAARPAMGKTNMALNIARHVAFRLNKYVLYFSLEMTSDELLGRLSSDLGRLDYTKTRKADFDPDEWSDFSQTIGLYHDAKLIIDESTDLSISTLASRARQEHRKHGLSLIIADHIGLIDADGENETVKTGKISRALKNLAKQLSVPVVALSQLNRSLESRTCKRPVLADLRQSGAIEQDANSVGFLFCDGVYNEESRYPDVAEVIWRKVRAGETGVDYFVREFHQCRFVEAQRPSDYISEQQTQKPKRPGRAMAW